MPTPPIGTRNHGHRHTGGVRTVLSPSVWGEPRVTKDRHSKPKRCKILRLLTSR